MVPASACGIERLVAICGTREPSHWRNRQTNLFKTRANGIFNRFDTQQQRLRLQSLQEVFHYLFYPFANKCANCQIARGAYLRGSFDTSHSRATQHSYENFLAIITILFTSGDTDFEQSLSKTPVRPLKPSTDGSFSEPSSSSRTFRSTRRLSQ